MKKFKSAIKNFAVKVGTAIKAPSSTQIQMALFLLGVTLLLAGTIHGALAQGDLGSNYEYNDDRIAEAVDIIFRYIQGSFGALVMVCAGIGAIISSAFGGYRAALGLLVVAIGAFILRSLVRTFFNDINIGTGDGVDSVR